MKIDYHFFKKSKNGQKFIMQVGADTKVESIKRFCKGFGKLPLCIAKIQYNFSAIKSKRTNEPYSSNKEK